MQMAIDSDIKRCAMKHSATATWNGTGMTGSGSVTVESNALCKTTYTFDSRFKNTKGFCPEELLAASHAADYTMKLRFVLEEAGVTADELVTQCTILFEKGQIASSHLAVKVIADDKSPGLIEKCLQEANTWCPLSIALRIPIIVESMD